MQETQRDTEIVHSIRFGHQYEKMEEYGCATCAKECQILQQIEDAREEEWKRRTENDDPDNNIETKPAWFAETARDLEAITIFPKK